MKPLPAVVALALLAAVAVAPAAAIAQPKDKAPAASASGGKTEFAAGRSRFASKDYAGALPLFRKAFDASGSPNASLYVGLCLIELAQPVEAYDVLSATARESEKRMAGDPAYQHTTEVAKEKLALLEKKVGRVTVTLTDAPVGATVTVNAKALPPERLGTPVALAPGSVTIVASATGQADQRADVVVAAGEEKPVTLHFAPVEHGGALAPAALTTTPSASGGKLSTMRVAGLAVAGVGVVGLVIFAVAGASSNAKYDAVKANCTGPCTDPKYIDDISSGKTLDGVANVGLAIGIVGLVGGGALFLLGGRRSDAAAALEVGPRSVRVEGTF